MCIKAGIDEFDSVCNLAGMAVAALVCDALDLDIEALHPGQHFVRDLGMSHEQGLALAAAVADLFDGLQVDLSAIPTVGALEKFIMGAVAISTVGAVS